MKWARINQADPLGRVRISGRKIYILPTKYGFIFTVLLVALLLGSINYANNPAFMLTFLLGGVFVNSIYLTWRNLAQLTLRFQDAVPTFAGEMVRFHFLLDADDRRDHPALQLSGPELTVVTVDLRRATPQDVPLARPALRRGRVGAGRLVVETRYPLGLLRAWSYVDLPSEALVYPTPSPRWTQHAASSYRGSESGSFGRGSDDFAGHRGYHAGDALNRIDWKAFAAEKGLLIKEFGGDRSHQVWLDWEDFPELDVEARLSHLCRGVIEFNALPLEYGLRLPGQTIALGHGDGHYHACLRALALFGEAP